MCDTLYTQQGHHHDVGNDFVLDEVLQHALIQIARQDIADHLVTPGDARQQGRGEGVLDSGLTGVSIGFIERVR